MGLLTAWIHLGNLRPCLELLAGVGETELNEGARNAFESGLSETDYATDHWFELPLGKLAVALAKGEGGRIHTRVEAPHGFGRAVEAVKWACSMYKLETPS